MLLYYHDNRLKFRVYTSKISLLFDQKNDLVNPLCYNFTADMIDMNRV